MKVQEAFRQRILRGIFRRLNNRRIRSAARRVALQAPKPVGRPVAFFKASTGIDDLSWNSGFHLLASWALRTKGIPVVYFACHAGMSRCVLGTNRDHVENPPPCGSCIDQSETLYASVPTAGDHDAASALHWFGFLRDSELEQALGGLDLARLREFAWPPAELPAQAVPLPLGQLCLPGLRWALRRHQLRDDEGTRFLLREYMLSAWNIAREFDSFLDDRNPRAIVVFNGQFFPEAVARHLALRRGIRVVTHEVGLQPASAFFTDGEATAYPIRIPPDFEMSDQANERLDAYLEQRFQGRFSMAGIQFWPSMRGLDEAFLSRLAQFDQIVPVFTNVIFDTSQPHANTVFPDMFAWLDAVLPEIRAHPRTLFVIRAHPDETRLRKESRETVEQWVRKSGALSMPNVAFIGPREYLSSYELIQRARFVMVYNSTIGLEASILGVPVLCAGKARFTQYPTVFFPQTPDEHINTLRKLLVAGSITVPPEFRRNARRFLHFQLFRTSLPFGDFLEPSVRTTQARLRKFTLEQLVATPSIKTIVDGLLTGGDFLLPDEPAAGAGT
jgi:hypothetical protein